MKKSALQQAAALLGRKGGLKGGKAKSPAKLAAMRRNLKKAQQHRWVDRKAHS